MAADVTIGMVTYNRLVLTKQTFEKALTYTGKDYNLIIYDNGSTDGTVEWLDEKHILPQCSSMTVVKSNINNGVAYGRNMCLKIMRDKYPESKFVSTIDNDVAIQNSNWLKDCCDVVESNEKYGVCAINYEKNKFFPPTTVKLLDGRNLQVRIILNTPGTATTVFRKQIHDKIGFFKRYGDGTYGHEDANYFVRVKSLGKMLFYLDEPGIHLGEGEYDVGEYREMKTLQFNHYRPEFVKDLHLNSKKSGLYLDFKE